MSAVFSADALTAACTALFRAHDLPAEAAQITAEVLVAADLRGIASHGVSRAPVYAGRLSRGGIRPDARPQLRQVRSAVSVIDAAGGMGPPAAQLAMAEAVKAAAAHGIGLCAVTAANHFGIASYYTMWAARRGLVGIACSNSDAVVAPYGARKRFFGTNPLAISFPAEDGFVPTLDMATSAAAYGKVLIAQANGEPLPQGWAVDAEGRPTTDPHAAAAGALLPFGGPKGSGLAFAIELLCGVLLGGTVSDAIPPLWAAPDQPQGLGQCFLAIDPGALSGEPDRTQAISAYARRLMALEAAPGANAVLAPGYLEWQREERHRAQGVPIAVETYEALQCALREAGCPPLLTADQASA